MLTDEFYEIQVKLERIEVLLLDVDGVMTDGGLGYTPEGKEIKFFNVKDGFGIKLLMESGIHVGIVTGRRSEALMHRCADLGIELIWDGVKDKTSVLESVQEKTGAKRSEMAFIGDDIPDLPLLNSVGLSIAVNDAAQMVKDNVDMVTEADGGKGAVREVCERILAARGIWDKIKDSYR